jgi:hypothetical protein
MSNQTLNLTLPTLYEALQLLNVDDLKVYLTFLSTDRKPTRKAELIAIFEEYLQGDSLRKLWEQLDKMQRLAVTETLYSTGCIFDSRRYKAKYGEMPKYDDDKGTNYRKSATLLCLFLYRASRYGSGDLVLPADLAQRLLAFVPKPQPSLLASVEELPTKFMRIDKEYEWQKDDKGLTIHTHGRVYRSPTQKPEIREITRQFSLTRRDTERDAQAEVGIMLRHIDLSKLAVSDKTLLPGASALKELAGILVGGDFYLPEGKERPSSDAVGPIKAFAWPLLLQAAGLAELHGKKLALTKAGRAALSKPAAETLRGIWLRWIKNKTFDEFSRIDAIKGQQGKGKRSMTAPAMRRTVIVEVLRQCSPGSWIMFDDFSRHMQATGQVFAVSRQPWDLYICDSNHGSLGYAGSHDWDVLQKRYLAVLFFEYAATLGLIDIAYVEPWETPLDFDQLWGVDDLSFLSRYDGLLWFRINALGAYCFDHTTDYQASIVETKTALTVLPSKQVKIVSGMLSTGEALFLETWSEREGDELWRLDKAKILNAVENGHSIAELRDFLEDRDSQGLPDTVEGFIATTGRAAVALKNRGPVLYIECIDAATAKLIASHELTKSLCYSAGPKHLAVNPENEERFRKAINAMGYGMPKI